MDWNRKTAFDVLLAVDKEDAYSNLALNHFINEGNVDNPSFVRELVYGVIENKILLDYYLDNLIPSGIKKVKIKETVLLRMGLYQLIFMNSVPDYAAVNESVTLAKKFCKGREGFINGVLRGYMKKKDAIKLPPKDNFEEYLSVKYSFPKWIISMWRKNYGDEVCEELLAASNSRPSLSIRVNLMKTDRESLKNILIEKGFQVEAGLFSERVLHVKGKELLSSKEYEEGLFSVQDEASTVAADWVSADEGKTVIDVCAAPGGKTMAIAEKMFNKGAVKACDKYAHKLELIAEQAKRLGINIIETKLIDGETGESMLDNTADRVLTDVPCSGLGVIRRKPEIKYRAAADLEELLSVQKNILNRASSYVKKGGTLVYSTCTINKKENEMQIEEFLKSHSEFELIDQRQFLPTEQIDGFFICKMIRKG